MAKLEVQSIGRSQRNYLSFNKICELEDFEDPELAQIMREVFRHEIKHFTPDFPKGAEYRKYWEVAMSMRALHHFGALRPDSVILGVGAGTEATLFYLTNHARQVFATDLYLNQGVWEEAAPGFMLTEPWRVAPYEFDEKRLVVQHMDGRCLKYPDGYFDAIFSSSSIEHFGKLNDIANASYEMGRVLKIGGVLTLSTEYCIADSPSGAEPDLGNVRLFSLANLHRYIVEASGLELVDEIDTNISQQTMASKHDLIKFLKDIREQTKKQGKYPRVGEIIWSKYPHIVLAHQGYTFGSIHLTLCKTEGYPSVANDWAKPQWNTIHAPGPQTHIRRVDRLVRILTRVPSLTFLAHTMTWARTMGRARGRH